MKRKDQRAATSPDAMRQLKNYAFDASITANSIANLEGIIIEANNAFLQLWGYPNKQEVIGKPIPHFLNDPNQAAAIFTVLNATDRWEGEFTAKRKDGSTFTANGLATVVRDENGQLIGYQSAVMDITGQQQAAEVLRESSELLTLFLRHSPIYSFIKTVTPDESRVLYASDNYQEMLGITGREMLNKTMTELFPAEIAAKITADDWAVVSNGKMMKVQEELHGRTYSSIKFPIVQGTRKLLAGYTLDITETKQAEQAMREWNQALEHRVAKRTNDLQQSEIRFRQLADAPFDGIAISEHGILIDGNAQLGQLHGYELSEMIGQPVSDFIAPESRKMVAAKMRTSGAMTYELFGLRKDGSVFPIEARSRIGLWQGKSRRITALRDLSEIKQATTKLQVQQSELEHARHLAMAGEISAGIVHQIGQPLCAMGANVRTSMVRIQACELKNCGTLEILNDVEADIGRLRDTVTQLRALSHPEQPIHLRRNFNDMVEDVLRLIRLDPVGSQIVLAVELGDDLPQVLADAGQLSHAIFNLVRNAFDACAACPPERRTVKIMTRSVAGQSVELCVRDTGTGISSKAMAGLFTPFFTTKPDGLGIGLRLSRTIVAAHGGRIEGLNNDDGIGATFRITLPAISQ